MLHRATHPDRAGRWRRPAAGLVATLFVAVPALGLTACAPQVVFTVGSTADAVDAGPGDGRCATTADECTLRAAVQEANQTAAPVKIVLAPGATYTLAISGTGEDAAATGDLDIARTVSIEGNGATIDAAGIDRAVDVVGTGHLTMWRTSVTGGSAPSGGGVRVGSGAWAELHQTWVTANTSTGFLTCGGGDFLPAQCSHDEQGGGGISSTGNLSLDSSTVSDNVAGPGATGCTTELVWIGLHQFAVTTCRLTVGGGIDARGTVAIVNSTISGNRAGVGTGSVAAPSGIGGGLFVGGTDAPRAIVGFTTIAGNTADSGAALFGSVTIGGSILAAPVTPTMPACVLGTFDLLDTTSAPVSRDHNLISDGSCGLAGPHDLASTGPQLGPLGANGGSTHTAVPAATSPAIDAIPAGTPSLCDGSITLDQRGFGRPTGSGCDIGAVERRPIDP